MTETKSPAAQQVRGRLVRALWWSNYRPGSSDCETLKAFLCIQTPCCATISATFVEETNLKKVYRITYVQKDPFFRAVLITVSRRNDAASRDTLRNRTRIFRDNSIGMASTGVLVRTPGMVIVPESTEVWVPKSG
jgi:hypothetical protein